MKGTEHKIEFYGLTSLRGIAALCVVVSHIDQFYYLFGYSSIGISRTNLADDAVTMFFVLSGFLITFLLLREKELFAKINIRNFYIRRILRIWPVYFIALIISLILIFLDIMEMPKDLVFSFFLYVFLLSNLAYVAGFAIRSIVPLWSVGVEEQFYLIWPLIVNRSRKLDMVMLIMVLFYLLLKSIFYFFDPDGGAYALIKLTRIDCMAIGGLLSSLYFKGKIPFYIKNVFFQIIALIFFLILSFSTFNLPINLEIEIKAVLLGVIILNIAINENAVFRIQNTIFDFLGRISYGLYVYHMIILFLFSFLLKGYDFWFLSNYWLMQLILISISVLFSHLSFKYIESRFLILKFKYS